MAVTIKDLAERVGKSITTVSRALHDYPDVSPETKALVRRVASEMGYTPNLLAQRLQKRRSDTLGLILPTFGLPASDPFLSEFLTGVGDRAARLGYDLMVSTCSPGADELEAYRERVRGGRIDGFILVRTRLQDQRVAYLLETGFPFVAFGRAGDSLEFPYVDEDGAYGMHLVAEHLLKRGHQRIGCIAAPRELTFSHHRLEGLRDSLKAGGCPMRKSFIRFGDLTQRSGYEHARALLASRKPPTAIVACNDLMAFGAIHAVQERGLRVGPDIAITGFDDIPMAEHSNPPLTTVHQPIYQIGGMVCEMLVRRLRGEPRDGEQVILQPSLVVRQSTKKAQTTSPSGTEREGGDYGGLES